jgi:hypothetical protein
VLRLWHAPGTSKSTVHVTAPEPKAIIRHVHTHNNWLSSTGSYKIIGYLGSGLVGAVHIIPD